MKELSKTYDPKHVEDAWFTHWEKQGYFHSEPKPGKPSFCVMIPPPNVTGMLTMGHVLNNTIQDILVRKARMEGFETMWLPGTDHAGIATQTRVEKFIRENEGKTRHDFGREAFVNRIWEWKDEYGGMIIRQLRKLGVSCDWERERFTLDDGLSKAVREVFVRLYEKGLIYKGKRIINWCPVSHTALSDEEVIHQEKNGNLWYFKYPVKDEKDRYLVIATTRPETMLGDTAVAVNPKDERYTDLVGKSILLPLADREIPIIEDSYVDMEFGTGAVKITPAHDPNDYNIGLRHKLDFLNIMNEDASMNENVPKRFIGMDRFACRKAIVKELKALNLVEKIEDYTNNIGFSERAHVPIEPRLSEQWFVKMEPLAKPALEAVNSGKIKFNPERWVKTYNHWLENIRDWCISRQLWWGHRIPVFSCSDCGWESAERKDPAVCPACGSKNIKQDEDVLDTWFSSWLWPFSTLGWPDTNENLKYYYPTNDMVTAPDIIFFWVARMIMAGYEFMGDLPFKNVYFTGLIRDMQGRKMSKSLGNSPDPLDVIDQYGADALRFGMMLIAPKGHDILFDTSQIELGRNFMNKLWNASRFVLMNIDENTPLGELPDDNELETPDRWILAQLKNTINSVNKRFGQYRFNDAAKNIYDFTWSNFCDWYIELIKPRLYGEDEKKKAIALKTAVYVLRNIVKLLHPYAPFITEEIWQSVKTNKEPDIMVADWPKAEALTESKKAVKDMTLVMDVITAIRTIRSEMTVPPSKKADVLIGGGTDASRKVLKAQHDYIETLAKVSDLTIAENVEQPDLSSSAVVGDLEIYVSLAGLIDVDKEKERLEKDIAGFEGRIKAVSGKLNNQNFVSRAPGHVVEHERKKLAGYEETLSLLKENYKKLVG
ncbi:MAG: valine--tRNA ligase [Candidatus Marinimicrobia bacterium]|nr:valine--tRNA ligase [Candidatus Neomarinimicrobiota bacterium]